MTQDELTLDGHAIEARIYAEDPDKGFLLSTGRLVHLSPPQSDHVRGDTGVEQGDEITPHYDPMIAKLIVWGVDRRQALARMRQALAQYRVVGVVENNVEFLSRLVAVPAFVDADLDTALIEREQKLLFRDKVQVPDEVWWRATLAELLREERLAERQAAAAVDRQSPWRVLDARWLASECLNGSARRRVSLRRDEQVQDV